MTTSAILMQAAPAGNSASGLTALLASPIPMMVIVFGIFFFLVIRPQQTAQKTLKTKIAAAQKGDTILTAGGIYGKVIGVDGDTLSVEIAQGVRVKVLTSTISDIQPLKSAKPANDKS